VAIEKLNIDRFLELAKKHPVLDVRSPGEYKHAHIPGAYSFPLFTDAERKVVGTTYKQKSREEAIKIGLDYFGPKMRKMVEEIESVVGSRESVVSSSEQTADSRLPTTNSRLVLLHCWRGGMRSAAIAWLLDLYGFKVCTLAGGYKKYRHWISETFSFPFQFTILGGYTGSGKTYVLDELEKKGAAVVNLEKLANHKGSAFGNMGEKLRALSCELRAEDHSRPAYRTGRLTTHDSRIWLEDESQRIGLVNIPPAFWNNMRQSPICFLDIPFEERLKHITEEYGKLDKQRMADAIIRIQKRLGGLETKSALQHLEAGEIEPCFRILLTYYDKWYNKGLSNRDQLSSLLIKINCSKVNAVINSDKITFPETITK
jgi:tRNA 2-selenouridine synthase